MLSGFLVCLLSSHYLFSHFEKKIKVNYYHSCACFVGQRGIVQI